MKNLGIFLVLLCALWLVGFLFANKKMADFKFMSVQHTNICRAVAAIIIILQLVMKVSFAMAFIGEIYRFRKLLNNGFITLVGGISYELYLVHFRLLDFPQKGIYGMCTFIGLSIIGAWIVNKQTITLKSKLYHN